MRVQLSDADAGPNPGAVDGIVCPDCGQPLYFSGTLITFCCYRMGRSQRCSHLKAESMNRSIMSYSPRFRRITRSSPTGPHPVMTMSLRTGLCIENRSRSVDSAPQGAPAPNPRRPDGIRLFTCTTQGWRKPPVQRRKTPPLSVVQAFRSVELRARKIETAVFLTAVVCPDRHAHRTAIPIGKRDAVPFFKGM